MYPCRAKKSLISMTFFTKKKRIQNNLNQWSKNGYLCGSHIYGVIFAYIKCSKQFYLAHPSLPPPDSNNGQNNMRLSFTSIQISVASSVLRKPPSRILNRNIYFPIITIEMEHQYQSQVSFYLFFVVWTQRKTHTKNK